MSDKYLHIDAQEVKAHIADLRAAFPELNEDDTLLLDTLEGETDFQRIVERALNERAEAVSMALAIKSRISDLQERKARMERKDAAMKCLIRQIMEAAGQTKITLPEATVTISKGKDSVGIEDVDQLPQGYFQTERKADKKAIKAAFDNGEKIPGAFIVTGKSGVTIRSK